MQRPSEQAAAVPELQYDTDQKDEHEQKRRETDQTLPHEPQLSTADERSTQSNRPDTTSLFDREPIPDKGQAVSSDDAQSDRRVRVRLKRLGSWEAPVGTHSPSTKVKPSKQRKPQPVPIASPPSSQVGSVPSPTAKQISAVASGPNCKVGKEYNQLKAVKRL